MDKYENFVQSAEWSVREEPAVKIFSVDLPSEIIDEVKTYIKSKEKREKRNKHGIKKRTNKNKISEKTTYVLTYIIIEHSNKNKYLLSTLSTVLSLLLSQNDVL